MSRVLHIVPGIDDVANGMAVVARLLAKEQGDAEVVDLNRALPLIDGADVEEVWVHGMWLPREWAACRRTLRTGKRLVRMTHGSLSPVYLKMQSPWMKRIVGPVEKRLFRKASRIVATCEAEREWIEAYLGGRCPPVEVTDVKRFFDFSHVEQVGACREGERVNHVEQVGTCREVDGGGRVDGELHVLYLGRRHPLKGVEYLEAAVRQIKGTSASLRLCARIISNAFGEELEKVWEWCDVLVLPTLSENFGLVVAEALERGKRVITTDGAPAWDAESLNDELVDCGRLIYLKGYRDGTDEERVGLLKDAIECVAKK